MSARPAAPEVSSPMIRAIRALVVAALLVAIAIFGFERSHRPLPAALSCELPTPRSCLAEMATKVDQVQPGALLATSEALARSFPGFDLAQSFHGGLLAKDGQAEMSGKFLLNSARLGWRDPAAQIFSYFIAVEDEDFARAALHLDSVLKLDESQVANRLLLGPLLASEDLRSDFAPRLAVSTFYRFQFLASYLGTPAEEWDARIDLLDKAVDAGLTVEPEQTSSLIWKMYREDGRRALDFWFALQGPGDFADGALAWDARLSRTTLSALTSPFVWHARDAGRTGAKISADDNGRAIVFGRRVDGPPRELAAIAVPLPAGLFPVSWKTTQGADDIFLGARCAGSGRAELVQVDQVGIGRMSAILQVDGSCEIPMITVIAGRGEHSAGDGISEVLIAERGILF